MATDSNVVYSESAVPGGRRTAITILGLAAVALVASVALELWWLLVPAVLVLLVGGVLLLSLWLYSTVRLTTEELSVGSRSARCVITGSRVRHSPRRGRPARSGQGVD